MCGYKKTSEQYFCHSDVFPVAPPASLIIYLLPYQPTKTERFQRALIRVVRLERTVSWSQTVCGNLAYYTSFLRVLQEGETLRMGGICRTTIHIEQEYNTRHGLQAIQ